MIKHCRLTIKFDPEKKMLQVLNEALEKANVKMEDISLCGAGYGLCTHFGNWVLTPVKNNEATKKVADVMGTELDYYGEFLEQEDLDQFNIGDRVSVNFISELGFGILGEGRVCRKEENAIVIIKKYRKRYGWKFRVGDDVVIRKIKAYSKDIK